MMTQFRVLETNIFESELVPWATDTASHDGCPGWTFEGCQQTSHGSDEASRVVL